MFQVVQLIRRLRRIFLNGLRFGLVNRDVRPEVARSCIEYWKLAIGTEFASFGRQHNPSRPVYILGLKLYTFDLGLLLFLMNEIFLRRQYAFEPTGETPLIIDCGSNIGISILFFKMLLPRSKIIGFEPDKETFELLSRNITENGLSDVCLHNMAVSSTTGHVTFYSNSRSRGSLLMSLVKERIAGDARQVPCATLSSFVQEPIDLLKVDIEGAEMDVMRELTASGALKHVNAMLMEFHHHIKPDSSLADMLNLLQQQSFGYDIGATLPASLGKFQDILIRVYNEKSRGLSAA